MSPSSSLEALFAATPASWLVFAAVFGYLLGSIPFGLLLTRAAGLGDVRQIGSGNIGATNVLRTGSKKLAAATLLLDGLKGTAAVLLADAIWGGGAAVAAGIAAFLGHLYPVWLRFKGGKGVATYIGVLAGLYWPAALVFCGVWLAVAFLSKYSSLAALTASLAAPLALWFARQPVLAGVALLLTVLLLYKHKSNIARLKAGQEPKIGAKA